MCWDMSNTVLIKRKAAATKRRECPFYGMAGIPGMLIDQGGDVCALMFKNQHSPCPMEMVKNTPNWDDCQRFNHAGNKEKIAKILDTFQAFPNELNPENCKSWSGVKAGEWFKHVMKRDFV